MMTAPPVKYVPRHASLNIACQKRVRKTSSASHKFGDSNLRATAQMTETIDAVSAHRPSLLSPSRVIDTFQPATRRENVSAASLHGRNAPQGVEMHSYCKVAVIQGAVVLSRYISWQRPALSSAVQCSAVLVIMSRDTAFRAHRRNSHRWASRRSGV